MLKLSSNLKLPVDFTVERIAFLARTGAGKSGGMRVMFEQMIAAKQFVVFIDPKGDAWGVRAAGVGHGLPVLIMGGDHADVPLQPTSGKFTAEFLVRERVSTVLDVSDFGKADMVRFVTDFASTMYRRNRDVVHVFLDEADMVAGERFYDPKCLEAIQLIQNKGRHRGFGVTVATQRSAMINKSVLFASGTLVAMQTTAPRDIKVVREWLEVCGTPEATTEIIQSLPQLKTREAFVYSPQHLGVDPVRITFNEFRTFDSMRTPKPGETRHAPKSLADIDLSAVTRDMADTIDEVNANDPVKLKARLRELERQFATKTPLVDEQATERAVSAAVADRDRFWQGEFAKIEKTHRSVVGRMAKARELLTLNGDASIEIAQPADISVHKTGHVFAPRVATHGCNKTSVPRIKQNQSTDSSEVRIGGGALRMVQVLADRHPAQFTEAQWATMSGLKRTGGTWSTYKSRLVQACLVISSNGLWSASDAAVDQYGDASRAPQTPEELREDWKRKLGGGSARMIDALW